MSAAPGWLSQILPEEVAEERNAAAEVCDDLPPIDAIRRAIGAGLVGDREQVREACATLVEIAHKEERLEDCCRWLLAAGFLAKEAEELEVSAHCFREVSELRKSPNDVVRALRAMLAAGQELPLDDVASRLLAEGGGKGLDWLGPLCEEAGLYDLAEEVYALLDRRDVAKADAGGNERDRYEPRLSLARLAIYRLSLAEARAHLEHVDTEEPEAMRLRAIIEQLEGNSQAALAIFDAVEAKRHTEARLFRAEALLSVGRFEAAEEALTRVLDVENSFAAYLLRARIRIAVEQSGRGLEFMVRRLSRAIEARVRVAIGRVRKSLWQEGMPWGHRFEPALYDSLSITASPERLALCHGDIDEASKLLEEVNRALGGNRSSLVTRIVPTTSGRPRLVRWQLSNHARQASALLLKRIARESPADVLKRFEPLVDGFPDSPYPFTYRGELRLWLGDYAGALADFENAIRREPTRWAYVGMSAIHMLLGDERRSAKMSARAVRRFGHLPAATTYVYRGELRRRQGDFKGAVADLELAVRERPSRVAARMNLALAYVGLNRHDEAERELGRAIEEVPGILWVTAKALGRALPSELNIEAARPFLEHAFILMRGNRSSWCYSIFDEAGRFRVLPPAAGWKKLALRELPADFAYGPP